MKYVLFGTPRFAEIILDHLIAAKMPPAALVCNPDRPAGRKKIVTAPATKRRALESDADSLDIIQPEKIDEGLIRRLKAIEADLFLIAAYAHILPKSILDIPRLGTIGIHPSLLPKYRGASPIQSAILGDEKETGVTLYQVDEKMDHGMVVAQEVCPIEKNESYLDLEEELANLGARLFLKTFSELEMQKIKPTPQDEARATYTKKFKTEDAFIKETDLAAAEKGDAKKAANILRMINAFDPEPGAWTMRDEKRIKLLKAEIVNDRLVLKETRS